MSWRNADGVWFRTVTPSLRSSEQNSGEERLTATGTTTRRPPCSRAPQISHTEKSKAYEWNNDHTSSAVKPNQSRVAENRRTTLSCDTTTPLGWPVDPEV